MSGSWLLDALRPKPYVAPLLPVEDVAREGHAYARAAIGGALHELASAAPGTRNETAFKVACRLVELCRAPWAGLSVDAVRGAYLETCAALNTDGTFLYGEHWSVWIKAERKVGDGIAVLPPAAHLGTLINFSELPPGGAGNFTNGATGANAEHSQSGLAGGVPDPFETAVRREHWMLAVRDEAKLRLQRSKARARDWAAELLSMSRMAEILPPQPLVEGWLFGDSLGRIVGPSRGLKSFVAMDIACCVATGRPWHGHITKQGTAVYVVGEGSAGTKQRVDAWVQATGMEIGDTNLLVLPWAVQTAGPEWSDFVRHLGMLKPALVVLDTQARVTVGRDENSAQDMGEAVAGWEELRTATGACVLLVHHTGVAGGERGRGSGAVFGALTSELLAQRSGTTLKLSCTKQKDVGEPSPIMLTAQPIGDSLVLVAAGDPDRDGLSNPAPLPMSAQAIGDLRARILVLVMREHFGEGNGATKAEIRGAFMGHEGICELGAEAKRLTFYRAWTKLEALNRIGRHPLGQRFKYIEIVGLDDLDDNPNAMTELTWPTLEA